MDNKKFERSLELLKMVSENYPEGSEEHKALTIGAHAILFIYTERLDQQFVSYVKESGKELTEEQRKWLSDNQIE